MSNEFKLTSKHIKLISHFYIDWYDCEFGAPCVDPKRPFGNSDVISDIGRILNIEPLEEESPGEFIFSDEQSEYILKWYHELQTALQIVLCTKSFKPGLYIQKEKYNDRSWKLKKKKGK